jgi:hypothetical protein
LTDLVVAGTVFRHGDRLRWRFQKEEKSNGYQESKENSEESERSEKVGSYKYALESDSVIPLGQECQRRDIGTRANPAREASHFSFCTFIGVMPQLYPSPEGNK